MCWFYMGIAQRALDPPPPPSVKHANVGKKVLQTILASLFTPLRLSGNAHMETTQKNFFLTVISQGLSERDT